MEGVFIGQVYTQGDVRVPCRAGGWGLGDIRPEPMSVPGTGSASEAGDPAKDEEGEDESYVAVDETGEGESSELVAQRANDGQMCR